MSKRKIKLSKTQRAKRRESRNRSFWLRVEKEKRKRGISFDAINEKGGELFAGASSIYRAAADYSTPSLDMIAVIAQAFDVSRVEVLRWADFIDFSPEDYAAAGLTWVEGAEVMGKLPVADQLMFVKQMNALAQRYADLDGAGAA